MAVEERRGCGFRKVGGMYLCGEYISSPCDRMPFPLTVCPVCGQGIKVSRGFTEVNPFRLWGPHESIAKKGGGIVEDIIYEAYKCKDKFRPCLLCDPPG
ncbi:unnamed protein product [marine sediment metagenome]|uniref:Uncharacterized protein n=1 Tax=marine sediment metagenome TaxID=412755 RepID=X1LZ65_9ZZZZ